MKKIALLFVGAASLFAACDKDEELLGVPGEGTFSGEEAVVEGYHHELTASVVNENNATRAGFDMTDGTFHWLGGDEISVANESNQFVKYTLKTGVGAASATFQTDAQTGTPQGYALHPHSAGHSLNGAALTFNLPASYTYTHTAEEYGAAPMVAAFEADAENLQFKHVGGAFCFQVVGVPAGTTWFKFEANAQITGNFAVTEEDGNQIIKLNGGAASSVTINIPSSAEARNLTFYIPVPTGTYNGFTISVGNGSETTWSYTSAATNTVSRKSLKKMPKVNLSVNTAEAVAEAFANGGICRLTGDVELDGSAAGLTLAKGKSLVLDLNGNTLSQEKECTGNYNFINNNGNLTITGNGTVSFTDTSAGDPNFGWGSYTIRNNGNLIVENGTIEHLGQQDFGTHMICALYQYAGSTIINGGKFSTPTYRSARLWSGSMIINDGEFDGQFWLQAVDNTSKLTINGGTFGPNGRDGSSVFIGNVDNQGRLWTVDVAVTGGKFETKIGCSNPAATGAVGAVTGGIFTESAKTNTSANLIATGYDFVGNGDGTYTVKQQ